MKVIKVQKNQVSDTKSLKRPAGRLSNWPQTQRDIEMSYTEAHES